MTDANQTQGAEIDGKLLAILVCPQTRGPLTYDRARGELVSKKARLAYPIRDGVPIMLIDEARSLSDEEFARL
ncbi:MAG: Trm112 family protein [Parvularculaceae bacterium]